HRLPYRERAVIVGGRRDEPRRPLVADGKQVVRCIVRDGGLGAEWVACGDEEPARGRRAGALDVEAELLGAGVVPSGVGRDCGMEHVASVWVKGRLELRRVLGSERAYGS